MHDYFYPIPYNNEARNISEEVSKLPESGDSEPVTEEGISEGCMEEGVSSTRPMRLRTQMYNNLI